MFKIIFFKVSKCVSVLFVLATYQPENTHYVLLGVDFVLKITSSFSF